MLLTPRNCCIGWMTNTSTTLSIRTSIQKELAERFNTNVPFQLTPKTIHSKQKEKFNTRALSIECSVQHAHQLETSIYENFNNSKMNHINNTTEHMEYIPLTSQEGISNHLLDTLIDKQNIFLSTFCRIAIKNTTNLPKNIILPNSKGFDMPMDLQPWLLSQRHTNTNEKFIQYIDTSITNHVFIYTTQTHEKHVKEWLHNFKTNYIDTISEEEKLSMYGHKDPFRLYYIRDPVKAPATYINLIQHNHTTQATKHISLPPRPTKRHIIFSPPTTTPQTNQTNQIQVITPDKPTNKSPPTPLQSARPNPNLITPQNKIIMAMQQAIRDHEKQIALLQDQITLQNKYTEMICNQVTQQTTMIQEIYKLQTTQGNSILTAIQHMSNKHSQTPIHEQSITTLQEPMQTYASTAQKRGIHSITMDHIIGPTQLQL